MFALRLVFGLCVGLLCVFWFGRVLIFCFRFVGFRVFLGFVGCVGFGFGVGIAFVRWVCGPVWWFTAWVFCWF